MIADSEIEELRKAGSSMGDFGSFGSGEILNQDVSIEPPSETDQSLADDYPIPAPTPKEWPPDERKGDGGGDAVAGDTSSVKSTSA
jgi:hypothetical protein